jgi:hypothetical protein
VHNEPLSIATMRVSNPHHSPFGIHGRDASPTKPGFAEIDSPGDETDGSMQNTTMRFCSHHVELPVKTNRK